MVAEGLARLTCGTGGVRVEACAAIAQMTQLRRLRLTYPFKMADARLRQLSALSRLTSLEMVGSGEGFDRAGSWLAALAAAQVPLRQLRLCDGGVQAGEPVLSLPDRLCLCLLYGLLP